jgi:RimJ/RimL family protein N-acetyltransferase
MPTILETPRLKLRPLVAADAPTIHEYCSDWDVACRLARVPHPYPDELAETFIARQALDAAGGTAHVFAIDYVGRLAGVIGIERRERGAWDLGYWLGKPWWGRGLATEAARRITDFGFVDAGLDRIEARHHQDNLASGRVLAKCGFQEFGRGPSHSLARGRDVLSVFVALDAPRAVA